MYINRSSRYGEYEGNATQDSLHHILVRIDLVARSHQINKQTNMGTVLVGLLNMKDDGINQYEEF